MEGLTGLIRLLASVGYVCVVLLLIATLASTPLGALGSSIEISASFGMAQVPSAVALIAGAAQAIGWGFILAGASYFRRVWFALVIVTFLVIFVVSSGVADGRRLAAILTLGAIAVWLRSRRGQWASPPRLVAEFVCWLGVGTALVAPLFFSATYGEAIAGFEIGLEVIVLLTIPFWFVLSVEVCELSLESGRLFALAARRWLGQRRTGLLTALVLAIPPLASFALLATDRWPMMAVDLVFGVILLAVAVLIWVFRRWTPRAAARLQVLSVALLVLVWSLSIGLGDAHGDPQDPLEWLLSWTPLPAVFVFVLAVSYNLLSFGARFCNGDSTQLPRQGRVLVYFGFDILVCSALLLFVAARDPSGESLGFARQLTTVVLGLGVLFLGLPYLAWLLLRRPDEVFGRGIVPS